MTSLQSAPMLLAGRIFFQLSTTNTKKLAFIWHMLHCNIRLPMLLAGRIFSQLSTTNTKKLAIIWHMLHRYNRLPMLLTGRISLSFPLQTRRSWRLYAICYIVLIGYLCYMPAVFSYSCLRHSCLLLSNT